MKKLQFILLSLLLLLTTPLQALEKGDAIAIFPIIPLGGLNTQTFPPGPVEEALNKLLTSYDYYTVIPASEARTKGASPRACKKNMNQELVCLAKQGAAMGAKYILAAEAAISGGRITFSTRLVAAGTSGDLIEGHVNTFPAGNLSSYPKASAEIVNVLFADFLETPTAKVTETKVAQAKEKKTVPVPKEKAPEPGQTTPQKSAAVATKNSGRQSFSEIAKNSDFVVLNFISGNTGIGFQAEILELHFRTHLYVTPASFSWQRMPKEDPLKLRSHWSLSSQAGVWYEKNHFGFRIFTGLGFGKINIHLEKSAENHLSFGGFVANVGFNFQYAVHKHFALLAGFNAEFPCVGSFSGSTYETVNDKKELASYRPVLNGTIGMAF